MTELIGSTVMVMFTYQSVASIHCKLWSAHIMLNSIQHKKSVSMFAVISWSNGL